LIWSGPCLDDPINRADAWGLEDSWWDGIHKIGDGLGQVWDKAPGGVSQAVSMGTKAAGQALSKTAEAYATNENLRNYTLLTLGAGALPIAAAASVDVAPANAMAAARNPDKIEKALDFVSGAFEPGPPPMTKAKVAGYAGPWLYNKLRK